MVAPASRVSFPYSDLLREPKRVLAFIDQGEVVELARRDGPNLRIELAERGADVEEALAITARILRGTLHEPAVRQALERILGDIFPWIEVLPEDEQGECITTLLRRCRPAPRPESSLLSPNSCANGGKPPPSMPTPAWPPT